MQAFGRHQLGARGARDAIDLGRTAAQARAVQHDLVDAIAARDADAVLAYGVWARTIILAG